MSDSRTGWIELRVFVKKIQYLHFFLNIKNNLHFYSFSIGNGVLCVGLKMLRLFEAGHVEGIYFKLCIGLVSLDQKSLSTKLGT